MFQSRYFLVAAMYAAGAGVPAGLVLYGLFPDWSLMYLADPAHLPGLLIVPFLAGHLLLGPPIGFWIVYQLLRRRWPHTWAVVAAGPGAALLGLLLGAGRVFTVAYYDAFHAQQAGLSLLRSELFLPLMLIWGAAVSVYVFAVLHVRRHVELAQGVPAAR